MPRWLCVDGIPEPIPQSILTSSASRLSVCVEREPRENRGTEKESEKEGEGKGNHEPAVCALGFMPVVSAPCQLPALSLAQCGGRVDARVSFAPVVQSYPE